MDARLFYSLLLSEEDAQAADGIARVDLAERGEKRSDARHGRLQIGDVLLVSQLHVSER